MAWFAAAVTFVGAVYICIDIFARMFLGSSLKGTVELTGFGLAISSSWAFGYALLHRAHVRVDIVHSRFGPKSRAVLDVLALAVLTVVAGTLAWYGYGVFARSFQSNATAGFSRVIHVWWFQAVWVAGLASFLVVAFYLSVRSLLALLRGDFARVAAIGGVISADEEVKSEIEQASRRVRTLAPGTSSGAGR